MSSLKKTSKSTPQQAARLPLSFVLPMLKNRVKQDIANWRTALNAAERPDIPRRYLLQRIYREVKLDGRVKGEVKTRKADTLSARQVVYNAANEPDENLTWLLKKPWFYKTCDLVLDSLFEGHSLIQIDGVTPLRNGTGGIVDVTLIPREHVVPEHGLLLTQPADLTGYAYREIPEFKNQLVETSDFTDLGLYNEAAPYMLWKRFAMGAYSEFLDLFAMPLRKAKTHTRDPEMMGRMEAMMQRMSSAAWAIVDLDEELDFIQPTTSNGEAFERMIKLCNNEISILMSGAITGGESAGGSRAKEEVGERRQNKVGQTDRSFLQSWVNHTLFPVLINLGYPLQGATFAFEEQRNLTELWKQVTEMPVGYKVPASFIEETFGIPVDEVTPPPPPEAPRQDEQQDEAEEQERADEPEPPEEPEE